MFKVDVNKSRANRVATSLQLPRCIFDKVKDLANKYDLSMKELLIQMISHCLEEVE